MQNQKQRLLLFLAVRRSLPLSYRASKPTSTSGKPSYPLTTERVVTSFTSQLPGVRCFAPRRQRTPYVRLLNSAPMGNVTNSGFVLNQEKADEHREPFLLVFKKTVLRIRDEERGNPIYLIRYSLFNCPWFSVKLHRIFMSDDDCLHDHPWSFLTFILWGGYTEHRPAVKENPYEVGKSYMAAGIHARGTVKKFHRPGSVLWRPYPSIHKLDVTGPATTLVITFRKKWDWGFYTASGWKLWKDYIRSGSKCE